MSHDPTCPFCCLAAKHYLDQNDEGFVIRDLFPVNPGHTLIIPKRHVGSFFELSGQEANGLWQLLQRTKVQLDNQFAPNDYNIGINDGPNAGQTVPHVHIHLMPRFANDTADPRGGVRRIIAERAIYTKDQG
jgi:diadenosine tetraphosphate (Ap4A) HIT family hydrolase